MPHMEESMAYDSLEPITGTLAAGFAGCLIGGMQRGAAQGHLRAARAAAGEAAAWHADSDILFDTVTKLRARIADYIEDDSALRSEINDLRHALGEARKDTEALLQWIEDRRQEGLLAA